MSWYFIDDRDWFNSTHSTASSSRHNSKWWRRRPKKTCVRQVPLLATLYIPIKKSARQSDVIKNNIMGRGGGPWNVTSWSLDCESLLVLRNNRLLRFLSELIRRECWRVRHGAWVLAREYRRERHLTVLCKSLMENLHEFGWSETTLA